MIKILVSFLSLCCANHEAGLAWSAIREKGKEKTLQDIHASFEGHLTISIIKHCWSCHSACKTSILLSPSTGSREASATPTDSQPGAIKAQTLEQGNHCCEWITLDHLWSPSPLLGIKSCPPVLPKGLQWSKNQPKMTPKSPPIAKNNFQIQAFWDPGPADCAKR